MRFCSYLKSIYKVILGLIDKIDLKGHILGYINNANFYDSFFLSGLSIK